MEALSQALAPHKELIGALASYLTIAQMFSGGFICNDIRKRGSTKDISSIPFVGGVMMGFAMLRYGFILEDEVMFTVNVAAILLNLIYIIFYYFYSENKWEELFRPISVAAAIVSVLWGYCEWEDKANLEFRYGLTVTILMLALLGSPLLGLKQIVDSKDASSIPFVLTLSGAVVTFFWLLYGIILLNNFMIIQNLLGFILCFVQLILIFLYPGKPKKMNKTKKTN